LVDVSLDEIDRAILARLQTNGKATLERIGEEVGLSAAAVQRRIKRFHETGIITSTNVVLDPRAVGVPIVVLVLVTLGSDGGGAEVKLDKSIAAHPNVQQAYELTGSFDRALMVTAPDMETYRSIVRELLDKNSNVKRYASHVVTTNLKRTLSVPLRTN